VLIFANLWGYIVRQSHDPYLVRDAAKVLGKNLEDMDDGIDPNLKSKKDILKSDGAEFTFGSRQTARGKDVAKAAGLSAKRVLHFKTADDWFDYNDKFGVGNLKESFFSGLQTAGRNIGIMDTLGTKPADNFNKIKKAVGNKLNKLGRSTQDLSSDAKFDKFLKVVDGSIYTVENFAVVKYFAIARSIASMAKLGGATVSVGADIGLYGSEMRYQGRSFLGGMAEAVGSLGKIKNTQQKKDIAEGLGFIADNTIYDVAGRYQVGDNLSKGFTKAQRFFFKLNFLFWWTNYFKIVSMVVRSNVFAK